ncbi:uncharacterized protein SOCG_05940 [Schizosaccharomyces octosporus yFS286]|uniref:Uncharacterized protein n=1 Tax=Schizosaccharomyces octosporus (strain yFS286) TaxID=483514 RepID=S9PTL5_SCHOY|nr:uncharacterized protein SOCG_05940 [Schizosaccharomyces octosporus yFS286]EPX70843.1 hypothetical protein SOCG_05940 [Schizosaccharomyces octosporus yFS286]
MTLASSIVYTTVESHFILSLLFVHILKRSNEYTIIIFGCRSDSSSCKYLFTFHDVLCSIQEIRFHLLLSFTYVLNKSCLATSMR